MLSIIVGAKYKGLVNGALWTLIEHNERHKIVRVKDEKGQKWEYGAEAYKRLQAVIIELPKEVEDGENT